MQFFRGLLSQSETPLITPIGTSLALHLASRNANVAALQEALQDEADEAGKLLREARDMHEDTVDSHSAIERALRHKEVLATEIEASLVIMKQIAAQVEAVENRLNGLARAQRMETINMLDSLKLEESHVRLEEIVLEGSSADLEEFLQSSSESEDDS